MTSEIFNEHLRYMQEVTVDTLTAKAAEYASDGDRLHNFKVAAATQGITTAKALGGMMCKHTVSVYDMIGTGETYPLPLWEEKIKDSINYLFLLWALVNEESKDVVSNIEKSGGLKMKLFISQPMRGKTDDEIYAARETAKREVERFFGKPVELIDSFFKGEPHKENPLWYLAKSLELMADADVVYFADGWQNYRGCKIEQAAAEQYGKDLLYEAPESARFAVDVERALSWLDGYTMVDDKEVYSNGTTFVPLYRVHQAFKDRAYLGLCEW